MDKAQNTEERVRSKKQGRGRSQSNVKEKRTKTNTRTLKRNERLRQARGGFEGSTKRGTP